MTGPMRSWPRLPPSRTRWRALRMSRRKPRVSEKIPAGIPNLLDDDVPDGADESANVEIRAEGERRNYGFTPRDHVALGEGLGLDFEAGAKLSGARFVVLRRHMARVERALANFMLDMHTAEFGYAETVPPVMVLDHVMYGTGQLPKFAEDLYKTTGDWLIPTAEVRDRSRGRHDLHRGAVAAFE